MPILRYNYRIKPTTQQEEQLVDFTSYRRGIWNLLLSENMRRYAYDGTFIFYKQASALLKELKAFDEFSWIKNFDAAAVQQVARDFDQALREAINKTNTKRFPRFKLSYHRKKLNSDCYKTVFTNGNIKIDNETISLPKIGKVPIVLHRAIVSEIKTVSIKFEHGHWSVSLTQNVPAKDKKKTLKTAIGYDINSKDMLVGSNGRIDKNPKFLLSSEEKLKQIQRQLSRRVKGSGRWHISKQRLNKLHGTIALFWSTQTGHFNLRVFKVNGRLISVRAMQSIQVVILHISSNVLLHMLPSWLSHFKYPIMLQTAKKSFDYGIIPASSDITH